MSDKPTQLPALKQVTTLAHDEIISQVSSLGDNICLLTSKSRVLVPSKEFGVWQEIPVPKPETDHAS